MDVVSNLLKKRFLTAQSQCGGGVGVGWMIVMWIIHTAEVLGEGKIKAAVKQVGKFLKRCHCQSAGTASAGVLHVRHRATGVRSDRIFPSLKIQFETQKCLWR